MADPAPRICSFCQKICEAYTSHTGLACCRVCSQEGSIHYCINPGEETLNDFLSWLSRTTKMFDSPLRSAMMFMQRSAYTRPQKRSHWIERFKEALDVQAELDKVKSHD